MKTEDTTDLVTGCYIGDIPTRLLADETGLFRKLKSIDLVYNLSFLKNIRFTIRHTNNEDRNMAMNKLTGTSKSFYLLQLNVQFQNHNKITGN